MQISHISIRSSPQTNPPSLLSEAKRAVDTTTGAQAISSRGKVKAIARMFAKHL